MSVLTAATDFPFENAQEITAKLIRYEEEFKNRYTEHDLWYDMTCKRPSRWYQVPTMHPWPPKPKRPAQRRRYEDWDSSSGHRHGGYRSGRGRSRGYDYRHRRDWSSGYHDEQLHGHWQPSSRSPTYTSHDNNRDRSPYRSPHRSPNQSWSHGHSPSHTHTHHHSPHYKPSHDQHEHQTHWKSRSRSPSPWRRKTSPKQQHPSPRQPESSPLQQEESLVHNLSEEHTTDQEKDEAPPLTTPPTSKPHVDEESSSQSETECVSKPRPLSLNLSELAGLGQQEQKDVPTKNDVMDILTIASMGSNSVTSGNLQQVKREAQQQTARKTIKSFEKSKNKRSHTKSFSKSSRNPPLKPSEYQSISKKSTLKIPHSHTQSSSILHITHGETEFPPLGTGSTADSAVEVKGRRSSNTPSAASLLKEEIGESKKLQKRIPIIESSSSSEEDELDVTTLAADFTKLREPVRKELQTEPLLVQLDKTRIPQYSQTSSTSDSFTQHTHNENAVTSQGTTKHDEMLKFGPNLEHGSVEHEKLDTSIEDDHTSYAVEYNPSMTTKMIIRTQKFEAKKKSKKGKKKRKKAKHKSTRGGKQDAWLDSSLKVKISLPPATK